MNEALNLNPITGMPYTALPEVDEEIATLRAEVERLTDILIACCNAAGGQAVKGVSVEFLTNVPAEIEAAIEHKHEINCQLTDERDQLTETIERLTRERDEARMAHKVSFDSSLGLTVTVSSYAAEIVDRIEWRPMDKAPKDGTQILLRTIADEVEGCTRTPAALIGFWDPEGDSWVDENGGFDGDAHHLEVTGHWIIGSGWLQPDEVDGWAPLKRTPNSFLCGAASRGGIHPQPAVLTAAPSDEGSSQQPVADDIQSIKAERDLRYQQALSFQESFDSLTTALFNAFGQPNDQHACEIVERLAKEVRELREQLAAALKDGERLNWLESDMPTSLIAWTDAASGCRLVQVGDSRGVGQDVRSAIDAAMKGDSHG